MLYVFYHSEITEKKIWYTVIFTKAFSSHKVNLRQTTPSIWIGLWIFQSTLTISRNEVYFVIPIFLLLFFPLLLQFIIPLCFITCFLLSNFLYIYLPPIISKKKTVSLIKKPNHPTMSFLQKETCRFSDEKSEGCLRKEEKFVTQREQRERKREGERENNLNSVRILLSCTQWEQSMLKMADMSADSLAGLRYNVPVNISIS